MDRNRLMEKKADASLTDSLTHSLRFEVFPPPRRQPPPYSSPETDSNRPRACHGNACVRKAEGFPFV